MKKTVLITGSSTGIGKEAALFFHQNGWNVAATMRNPEKRTTELHSIDDILKLHLDVQDTDSIRAAIQQTVQKFETIDVVVNNAGYGLAGPFEAAAEKQIRRQFDTNLFGMMSVVRQILPLFRERKSGTIVNVSSVAGRVTFPFLSLYHATKWAVEGFSESLQHELRPFNIRVKLVEPGPIKTDFYDRSLDMAKRDDLAIYDESVGKAMHNMMVTNKLAAGPRKVAKIIYKAANGNSWKLRYPAHDLGLLKMRWLLPDRMFNGITRAVFLH